MKYIHSRTTSRSSSTCGESEDPDWEEGEGEGEDEQVKFNAGVYPPPGAAGSRI